MASRNYSPRGAERVAERRERRIDDRRATLERRAARVAKYGTMAAAR